MPQYKDIYAILNNLPNDLPYKASVKRVLIQAPEADVVPKSEVERLHEVINGFEEQSANELQQFLTLSEKYENAKTEVERLEKEIKALLAFKDYFSDLYGHGLEIANWHENGELEYFDMFYESAVDEYEAELKKKYTEDKNENT
jgi:hypothetical protein